jgi:hypothetical protein
MQASDLGVPAAGKLKVLPQINLTPEMHVAFNTLHVAGMLRVTLTPIMQVSNMQRTATVCPGTNRKHDLPLAVVSHASTASHDMCRMCHLLAASA